MSRILIVSIVTAIAVGIGLYAANTAQAAGKKPLPATNVVMGGAGMQASNKNASGAWIVRENDNTNDVDVVYCWSPSNSASTPACQHIGRLPGLRDGISGNLVQQAVATGGAGLLTSNKAVAGTWVTQHDTGSGKVVVSYCWAGVTLGSGSGCSPQRDLPFP